MPTMTCTAAAVQQMVDRDTPWGLQPAFLMSAGQLVTPPIRGRAGELKVIGGAAGGAAQGRGGVLVIEGARRASARVGC